MLHHEDLALLIHPASPAPAVPPPAVRNVDGNALLAFQTSESEFKDIQIQNLETRNYSVVELGLVFCTGCNISYCQNQGTSSQPPEVSPTKGTPQGVCFFGWCPNFKVTFQAISGNLRLRKSQFLNSKSKKFFTNQDNKKSDDLNHFSPFLMFLSC